MTLQNLPDGSWVLDQQKSTVPNGSSALVEQNLKLLETGEWYDLVIKCGDKDYKVHRSIVCPQSFVLTSLCDPKWKEGLEGRAELKEQEPAIFEKALQFFYTGTYDSHSESYKKLPLDYSFSSRGTKSTLLTDIKVYVLADYLNVEELKFQALVRCARVLEVPPHREIYEAVCYALNNTMHKANDGLRRQILKSCANTDYITLVPGLEQLLREAEPLAWSLLIDEQKEKRALQDRIRSLVLTAGTLDSDRCQQFSEVSRSRSNIEAGAKLLSRIERCRNQTCKKEFGAQFELRRDGLLKGLRCKRCKCKHSMT